MSSIRWRESDIDKLRKEIERFNRKITRLKQKGDPVVTAALPERLSYKKLKKDIVSRSELNRLYKSIERFTARGSEQKVKTKSGVETTKFELADIRARVASINARRKAQLKALGKLDAGNIPLMGRVRDQALRPKQAPGKISPENWEEYKRAVKKQTEPGYIKNRMERYRENYKKALRDSFGEEADEFINEIDDIPVDKFVNASITDEDLYIDVFYDPVEKSVKKERITNALKALKQ